MLRWTNISPGSSPTISFAGTRLSEQPIHRYAGACWPSRRLKKPGSRATCALAQARLLALRSSSMVGCLWAERPCVQANARPLGQRGGRFAEHRMGPVGRDLGQGSDDEQARVRARMRKHQFAAVQHLATIGDQVEVEGSRGVQFSPQAAEFALDAAQGSEGLERRTGRLDKHE